MGPPANDITEAVGLVPIVRLNRLGDVCRQHRLYLKLECCNPCGSMKEKSAIHLIREAEERELLMPGGTIVEASTGNFGIGLAMIGASRGYRVVIVVDTTTVTSVKRMIRAYGAEIVEIPTSSARIHGSLDLARSHRAKELAREISGAWQPAQSLNTPEFQIHSQSTAKEIETAFEGAPDAIVLEVSARDELSGIAGYFRARYPATQIVGVAVSGAVTRSTFSSELLHSAYSIPEEVAISTCHAISRKEGLLLGGSTGAIVAAGLNFAQSDVSSQTILMINPDRGDRYLETLYDPAWLEAQSIALLVDEKLNYAIEALSPLFRKEKPVRGKVEKESASQSSHAHCAD